MAKQLFINNFETTFIAPVKDAPTSGTPATELDYGVLRISDGAAGALVNPAPGDFYVLTAYKRSGTTESSVEILRVTAVNNATPGECRITVLRAQEGTTAQAYVSGDHLALRLTKGGVENFAQVSDASGTPASAIGVTPAGGIAATDVQAALQELDAEKEPAIAAGATAQYWRGDKTWRDLFADVRAATLTGLSTATNAAIGAADTVLAALGKLQRQVSDHLGAGGAAHANATTTVAGFMSGSDKLVLGLVAGAVDGGAVGQILYKVSATDYDLGWKTLGSAADMNTGTSGATVPLLNGANTWSANQSHTAFTNAKVVHFSNGYFGNGNSGSAITVNFANGQKQVLTLSANCTVTLTAPGPGNYQLQLTQDSTGNRTVTWAVSGGTVLFVGSASAPAISTAADGRTMVSFFWDGSNAWLAAAKVNA